MSATTEKLRRISYAYQDVTGEQLFMYVANPTEKSERYVFNNETVVGAGKAEVYAGQMLAKAKQDKPKSVLVSEEDFPGAKRARINQHANTVSAAIVHPPTQYVVESELFIDIDEAREWLVRKAKEAQQ